MEEIIELTYRKPQKNQWSQEVRISGVPCERCKTKSTYMHMTAYSPGFHCFPLCSECWIWLTPAERLPFYMSLVNRWGEEDREYWREAVKKVVLKGG